MSELKKHQLGEETEVLQERLRTNSYTDEAAALARSILADRHEQIPVPETEEEERDRNAKRPDYVARFILVLIIFSVGLGVYLVIHGSDRGRSE